MRFAVVVNAESLIASLRGFNARFISRLEYAVRRLAIEVQTAVKDTKLSGQVLKVRTGTLRRSINQEVRVSSKSVEAIIGTNVEYAAAHEYGGPFQVKAHLRMMRTAWNRPVKNPRMIQVRAHTVNMPERSFLRTTLNEFQPRIENGLRSAAMEAIING